VAIPGIGAIGEKIARKCKAFGMRVFGMDIVKRKVDAVDYSYGPMDLLKMVQEVDYFIIVVPSTLQKRGEADPRQCCGAVGRTIIKELPKGFDPQ